jgi:redox-sensitive bicupin YhaK (pirin superfamily)
VIAEMSKLNVTPTTPINAMLTRVIGSTDIRGQGTKHAIEDINPFSLLDEGAVFTKKNTPPFGRHPHAGAFILTICLMGSLNNMTIKDGKEVTEEFGPGPFLLALSCNRGVVHDEHTSSDQPTKLLQLVWMTGDQSSDCSFEHIDKPKLLKEENYEIMLCCGTFREVASGISCKQNPSVTVLVIKMSPGSMFQTDEFRDGNVFVYSVDYEEKRGPLVVNDNELPSAHIAHMTMEASNSHLKIENKNEHSVSVLIGYGKPIQPKCKKLLMFNGFIFAPSEEELKKKEDEFKKVGAEGFGQKPDSCNLM